MKNNTTPLITDLVEENRRVKEAVEIYRMNLRDEFAMAALQGCLAYSYVNPMSGNYHENASPEQVAGMAYVYADAMLKARND